MRASGPPSPRPARTAKGALALAVVALLAASPARAAGEDATSLLKRGVDLRREHKDEDALAAFKEAARLSPSPVARAQIALAEQALGRWLDAERDLAKVLADPDDPWIAKNHDALEEARGMIDEHCAWLTVDANVERAEITLDDRTLARGREERVVAGSTILVVQSSGYVPVVRHVDLAPRSHTRLAMILAPLVATPLPSPATLAAPRAVATDLPRASATREEPSLIGPLALSAIGGVALVVGASFGVHALNTKYERDGACAAPAGCPSSASAQLADIHEATFRAGIALGVSAASFLGAGAWWLLTRRPSGGQAAHIDVAPRVGPSFAGLAVEGRM
jgi:hypothetical protein